jgi:L-fuculose-phosphate aldolase
LITNHDAIVLQRHGTLTVGRTPLEGFMRLETVEQNARIAFMLTQLGVRNPLEPAEVRKLLEQRAQLGLARPGEAADFCEVCGVCHVGSDHAPTMQRGAGRLEIGDSGQVEAGEIRNLVAQVVQKTLGSSY